MSEEDSISETVVSNINQSKWKGGKQKTTHRVDELKVSTDKSVAARIPSK